MGRNKGGKNKVWTPEVKLAFVKRMLQGESPYKIADEENVARANLQRWMKNYNDNGKKGLINTRKPGNPLSKYQNRKDLTELERLEYENMKLRIENLRLKKGYTSEEVVRLKRKKSLETST